MRPVLVSIPSLPVFLLTLAAALVLLLRDQLRRRRWPDAPRSANPLAFHHYNPDELVDGKPLSAHLRFSIVYWHTMCGGGADMFGWPEMAGTIAGVWRALPEADSESEGNEFADTAPTPPRTAAALFTLKKNSLNSTPKTSRRISSPA